MEKINSSKTEVFTKLFEQGATLITASNRQARYWTELYHRYASERASVWPMPDILPVAAWLKRLLETLSKIRVVPVVLDKKQTLWCIEQVIKVSPEHEYLISLSATAKKVLDAFQQLNEFQVSLTPADLSTQEHHAFDAWASKLQSQLQTNNWIDESQLSEWIAGALEDAETRDMFPNAKDIYLLGFHQVSPSLKRLINAFSQQSLCQVTELNCQFNLGESNAASATHQASLYEAQDLRQELLHSAQWAAKTLLETPSSKVAVIIPGLEKYRFEVEQIFRQELHSSSLFEPRSENSMFNISVGKPLNHFGAFRVSLTLIKLLSTSVSREQLAELLVSDNIGFWFTEFSLAQLEAIRQFAFDLPAHERVYWSLSQLIEKLNKLCEFSAAAEVVNQSEPLVNPLTELLEFTQTLPKSQSPERWTQCFIEWLKCWGWSAGRSLSSFEYQLRDVILQQLSLMKRFNLMQPKCTLEQAYRILEAVNEGAVFQPKSQNEPIQIIGLFEAVGLTYDQVWICGLNNEVLPSPPEPNPFIPLTLARDNHLPGSGPERELDYATQLLSYLLHASEKLHLSYYRLDGERELSPSQLVVSQVHHFNIELTSRTWQVLQPLKSKLSQLRPVTTEHFYDEQGLPYTEKKLRGGSQFLHYQSLCPMQGYLAFRLNLSEQEVVHDGIDPRVRGNLIHDALQRVWSSINNHSKLIHMSEQQLNHEITHALEASYHSELHNKQLLRELEIERSFTLIRQLLELEKKRAPFQVTATEYRVDISIGGLVIACRLDRLDKVEALDSEADYHVVLDYKTGKVSANYWLRDRIVEPQLPLYMMSDKQNIRALGFAQVNPDKVAFYGVSDESNVFPSVKTISSTNSGMNDWREFSDHLEQQLIQLVDEIKSGVATVTPNTQMNACQYCPYDAICRVDELESHDEYEIESEHEFDSERKVL